MQPMYSSSATPDCIHSQSVSKQIYKACMGIANPPLKRKNLSGETKQLLRSAQFTQFIKANYLRF